MAKKKKKSKHLILPLFAACECDPLGLGCASGHVWHAHSQLASLTPRRTSRMNEDDLGSLPTLADMKRKCLRKRGQPDHRGKIALPQNSRLLVTLAGFWLLSCSLFCFLLLLLSPSFPDAGFQDLLNTPVQAASGPLRMCVEPPTTSLSGTDTCQ